MLVEITKGLLSSARIYFFYLSQDFELQVLNASSIDPSQSIFSVKIPHGIKLESHFGYEPIAEISAQGQIINAQTVINGTLQSANTAQPSPGASNWEGYP